MGETRVRKSKKKATDGTLKQSQHAVESKLHRLQIDRNSEPPSTPETTSMIGSETTSQSITPSQITSDDEKPIVIHEETVSPHEDDMTTAVSYFEVKSTPNKGHAVFASRKIQPGTLVLAETPLIRLTQAEEDKDADANNTSSSTLDRLFKSLPKQTQKSYLTLYDSHKSDFSRVKSIYYSNCYNLSGRNLPSKTSPGGSCIGLTASRLNHSCIPNVQFSYDEPTNQMRFFAIKPIPKGKELVSTYDTVYEIRSHRQRKQMLYYGFQCDCEACEWKTEFWAKSDERRKAMIELRRQVRACDEGFAEMNGDSSGSLSLPLCSSLATATAATAAGVNVGVDPLDALERLETLLVKEGIAGAPLVDCYKSMAKWAERLGGKKKKKILNRARDKELETARMCFGDDSPRVTLLKEKGLKMMMMAAGEE